MKVVAILGVGGLGSRHLQGVAKATTDIRVDVVDPSQSALRIAKQRYEEVENNKHVKEINFFSSLDDASLEIDLAIVATNADIRFNVVKELFSVRKVKAVVLEKVLFQKLAYYEEFHEILEKKNVSCWVNHPRRMYPFYKKLKDKLLNADRLSFSYQGGSWGLGCNALHFIDSWSFLTDSTELVLNSELLEKQVYPAKRQGFVEFHGMLTGRLGEHAFSIYSGAYEAASALLITSDSLSVYIDEANGVYKLADKENSWSWNDFSEKIIYFQSELSGKLVDDVLRDGSCELPSYREAMALHVPFVASLLEHESLINNEKRSICRIT